MKTTSAVAGCWPSGGLANFQILIFYRELPGRSTIVPSDDDDNNKDMVIRTALKVASQ